MAYSFVSYTDTLIKVTEGTTELFYKKVYCSTSVDGDYFIFSTHQVENNRFMQQYKLLYTDCVSPAVASASALKTAVDAIIDSYAGGGGATITAVNITVPSPIKEYSSTISDALVSTSSKIIATHSPTAETDANFGSSVFVYAQPLTGQIGFKLVAPENDLLYGVYTINYTIA